MDFRSVLQSRGLLHQTTHGVELDTHLQSGRRLGYAGFDPTADSLTVGHLVPLMLLAHFQRAGHTPLVVVGGGTGLIGDPSGKSAERPLLSEEQVAANVVGLHRIFSRVLDPAVHVLNNGPWLRSLVLVDFLRDVGKHFSVNTLLQRDSVQARLESREQGLSFTEFTYGLLQGFDFLHLHKTLGVTVQMGGSDQWGNILLGTDLIHRVQNATAFGVTAPLVTKSDGKKFGKTESGAVWLTADRTSPFAFFQFWMNVEDADLGRFLRLFTFLPLAEIEDLLTLHAKDPGARLAHRALALSLVEMLHGVDARIRVSQMANALFSGNLMELPEAALDELWDFLPHAELPWQSTPLVDALVLAKVAPSKREARQLLQNGAIQVNGTSAGIQDTLDRFPRLQGRFHAIRRGKKNWHLLQFPS